MIYDEREVRHSSGGNCRITMKKLFFILFTLAAVITTSADNMPEIPVETQLPQKKVFRNIPFAHAPIAGGGTKDLKINIWKGKGEGAQPVVLFVHGGAWISGNNELEDNGSSLLRFMMSRLPYDTLRQMLMSMA